jgi:hypothetical protein
MRIAGVLFGIAFLAPLAAAAGGTSSLEAHRALVEELVHKYGEPQRASIERGVRQVSQFWRDSDGNASDMDRFVEDDYAGTPEERDALFARMEFALESFDGHMTEIVRDFRRQSDLDVGPIYPFDRTLAGYDPSAHALDDLFANKIAFTVLLNFPLTTLEERLAQGPNWTRRQWAEARLAQRFGKRVPADVNLAIAQAGARAEEYIAGYNIWMRHVLDEEGRRLFPPKMRLLSHWNLRDELKADYAEGRRGLAKQRVIARVMERIVTQTIPAAVVDNPGVDWNPFTNAVTPAAESDAPLSAVRTREASAAREPDTRYAELLATYRAARLADPYSPTAPTLIARRFDENRELPEARVRAMLEEVVSSPLAAETARLIRKRLGRKLEPFDIWYNGFRAQPAVSAEELDRIVRERYPTAEAYQEDIPNLLVHLGFSPERARWVAANIVVDPARGSGHAMGAARRADQAHLRTRVEKDGMNYKGFNIAVHEMGHNVEQTFSLNAVDHTLLAGVPNTAFTEALAFVFQAHDLELLGVARPDAKARAAEALNDFWGTYEISGVALVDMGVWHWMYDHPEATAAELRDATVAISRDVWNRYYAPVFGVRDVVLLGVYSHMIDSFLYLPDYPIGHMIAFQIRRQIEKSGNLGAEFERMARFGSVTPDLWMEHATGEPVGPGALLAAAGSALAEMR